MPQNSNKFDLSELLQKLQNLETQNQLLQSKLESLLEGGGIKILFPDKFQAKQILRLIRPRILKPFPDFSINPLNSPNLILEGDNLQTLASLAKYYNVRVFL